MNRSEILALRKKEILWKWSELQLCLTGFKEEPQERFLTFFGMNNNSESETEDNGDDGGSVLLLATNINPQNGLNWH